MAIDKLLYLFVANVNSSLWRMSLFSPECYTHPVHRQVSTSQIWLLQRSFWSNECLTARTCYYDFAWVQVAPHILVKVGLFGAVFCQEWRCGRTVFPPAEWCDNCLSLVGSYVFGSRIRDVYVQETSQTNIPDPSYNSLCFLVKILGVLKFWQGTCSLQPPGIYLEQPSFAQWALQGPMNERREKGQK